MGKGDRKKKPKLPALIVKPTRRGRNNASRSSDGKFSHEDPRTAALGARARQMGQHDTKEARLQNTAPHLGDDVGRCLERLAKDQAAELWKVWSGFCASRWHYRRRILGKTGFPAGMSIQMAPERFETDQSHTVDARSEEERDADARANYDRWNAWAGMIPLEYGALLHSAENGHAQVWADAGPTAQGYRIVGAIMALRDVVE